ncbi:MAG: elongation factor P maturation arginine rhamnosyltransferase EarP, partial [Methylophilaceae bacterium]|nr:elongation factor P maturation arginine rhamnosyltransferase EarP [Methylophilaceae bacterium]
REKNLLLERDAFQRDAMQKQASTFWQSEDIADNPLKVSLFCYPHAPLHALLNEMANAERPTSCLVPERSRLVTVSVCFGTPLQANDHATKGNLTVKVLPFLSQQQYDQLLWSCDLNFVRGEDSWVRAIWAAKPFVWLPYHQAEETHLVKLHAFLEQYTQGLEATSATALRNFHTAWASSQLESGSWQTLTAHMPVLESHAQQQAKAWSQQPDLAAKLVIFCENFS